jgi:hypothetical protein
MAFFWCAFSLQVIYYLDKLSLTRTWKRVPKLGATIAQFNRTYFLPVSVIGELYDRIGGQAGLSDQCGQFELISSLQPSYGRDVFLLLVRVPI